MTSSNIQLVIVLLEGKIKELINWLITLTINFPTLILNKTHLTVKTWMGGRVKKWNTSPQFIFHQQEHNNLCGSTLHEIVVYLQKKRPFRSVQYISLRCWLQVKVFFMLSLLHRKNKDTFFTLCGPHFPTKQCSVGISTENAVQHYLAWQRCTDWEMV